MIKKPTLKQKVEMYEKFFHDIQMYSTSGQVGLIQILINNACDWSYAHRVGNGELSEKQQNNIIAKKFWKLTTVPDILL